MNSCNFKGNFNIFYIQFHLYFDKFEIKETKTIDIHVKTMADVLTCPWPASGNRPDNSRHSSGQSSSGQSETPHCSPPQTPGWSTLWVTSCCAFWSGG